MKRFAGLSLVIMVLFACASGKKVTPTNTEAQLEDTYWKLVELNGQPINQPAGGREYHIQLKKADSTVAAFAGCNGLGGNYQLAAGNRLRFSQMISTMMACPELDTENRFKKMLEAVDNYAISGNALSLNKARMAPLARFEAVAK